MGNDGGTKATTRKLIVRQRKAAEKVDNSELLRVLWNTCAWSGEALQPPLCICRQGRLYNKKSILEALAERLPRSRPGFEHVGKLSDLKTVEPTLTDAASRRGGAHGGLDTAGGIPATIQCPITGVEANGGKAFVGLWGCGHILSRDALLDEKNPNCPYCGKVKGDIIPLNPSLDSKSDPTPKAGQKRPLAEPAPTDTEPKRPKVPTSRWTKK